jgi:MscS family membrane protein
VGAHDAAAPHEKTQASDNTQEHALIPQKLINDLPPILRVRILGTQGWKILALVLIFCVGLLLRKILQIVIHRRLSPMAAKFGAESVGHAVDVFAGPGSILVVSGLLALLYPELDLNPWMESVIRISVRSMAILSIVLSLYRLVDVLADRMAAKAELTDSRLDDQLVPLVRKALKVLVILSGALFLLQNLDVNVGSLVAGLGIGGVAVALAAKDTIANFFGSLMIFIDRPFQIGDWVKIGDVEGIVEVVGFRSTRVRTFYNSLVTVPNAHFTESAIDNIGLREYRRIKTVLNLTYDTSPEQIQAFVEGIRAIICANDFTRKDYYEIHFNDFGAHSLDLMVYLFVKVDSWSDELRERHNILLEILRLAKHLGVDFAFPTQTLHLDSIAAPGENAEPPTPPPSPEMGQVIRSFGPGGELSRPASPLLTDGYLAGTVKKIGGDG